MLNAAGYTQWVPIAYNENWFGATIACIPSEDSNLIYAVQLTFDYDNADYRKLYSPVSISRSGTTATVTWAGPQGLGHGLTTGDSVIIKGSGSTVLDSPGAAFGPGDLGWQVASTPSNKTFTYVVTNSGATADTGATTIAPMRVFNHATLVNQTSRQADTINYPARAVRLYISSYTAGYCDMTVLQGVSP
jgi:hypothetical protein